MRRGFGDFSVDGHFVSHFFLGFLAIKKPLKEGLECVEGSCDF